MMIGEKNKKQCRKYLRDSYVSDVLTFTQLMAMKRLRVKGIRHTYTDKNVNHENGQQRKCDEKSKYIFWTWLLAMKKEDGMKISLGAGGGNITM